MTKRGVLLAGLSAICLQGCIAAAAIPIVAGAGGIVGSGVASANNDDERDGTVTVARTPVTAPAPTPAPTPTPAPVALSGPTPAPSALPATATPVAAQSPAETALASAEIDAGEPSGDTPSDAVTVLTLSQPSLSGDADAGAEQATSDRRAAQQPAIASVDVAASAVAEPVAGNDAPGAASFETTPQQTAQIDGAAPYLSSSPGRAEPDAPLAAADTRAQLPAELPATPSARPAAQAAAVAEPPAAAEPPALSPAEAAAQEALASIRAIEAERNGTALAAGAAASPATSPFEQAGTGYAALRSYALQTLSGGIPLPSAQLADSASLQPVRRTCESDPPTVVLDLDPAGGIIPLVGPVAVNTELARVLSELRARGVNIAWITDRSAIDARAIRDRLVASGLDPDSRDAVYVERYPGETKQARREALAQNHCVIAMAGDERSDFDDLYNYIINDTDARSLEPMLGAGWFLINNPVGE